MKKIVILTGSETRHVYFRKKLSNDSRFRVVGSICEGSEHSLKARIFQKDNKSFYEINHVLSREQSELDFFEEAINNMDDHSNPIYINKGDVNTIEVVDRVKELNPDLIICYGSSIIKSDLIIEYDKKFLNVHLGISPYYRGSGTNVWPIINNDLDLIGATFMHLDSGIDSGEIIHQIRADIFLGDSPHTIGNRLIKKMSHVYADIIANFGNLSTEVQPSASGILYKNKDFDEKACESIYQNIKSGIIENYLKKDQDFRYIVKNKGLD